MERVNRRSLIRPAATFSQREKGGFTLIELLVVVLILLLVTGITIPIVAPAIQGRHIREASRQINSYFAVARDTALRTRRPVGVMIQRFSATDDTGTTSTLSEMSVVLSQVEVPPTYSGDFVTSRAIIDPSTGAVTDIVFTDNSGNVQPDQGWLGLVRSGDMIQFNYQGRYYYLGGFGTGNPVAAGQPIPLGQLLEDDNWTLTPIDGSGGPLPWTSTVTLPFSIVRQPVPTAAQPLQLTGPVIIDLNWSSDSEVGVFVERELVAGTIAKRTAYYLPDTTNKVEDVRPIIVMFAPNGSLERIYRSQFVQDNGAGVPDHWEWVTRQPTGPIHLLIGQREAVPANPTLDAAGQEANNWRNLDNLWVSIHPQTGLITTTENVDVIDPVLQVDPYNGGITAARQYAIRAQSMGGR